MIPAVRTGNSLDQQALATPEWYNVVQFLGRCKLERRRATSLPEAIALGEQLYAAEARGVVIYAVLGSHGAIAETIPRRKPMPDVKSCHVVTFTKQADDTSTVNIYSFATEEEAAAELNARSGHELVEAFQVSNPTDLEDKLSMAQLVALYNILTPEKTIKSFHDMGAGAARTWNRMNPHLHPVEGKKAKPSSASTPIPATEVEAATAPSTQTEEATDMAKKAKQRTVSRGTKKDKAPRKGRSAKFPDDAKITILSDGNPLRKGSAAYKRFDLMRTGMTVKTALEKGVWRADLNWDVKKKFIRIG